jgi:hypothetical protein
MADAIVLAQHGHAFLLEAPNTWRHIVRNDVYIDDDCSIQFIYGQVDI